MKEQELTPKQKMLSEIIGTIGGIIVAMAVCVLMGSCKTQERVTEVRDTVRIVMNHRDSIHILDSVYVKEYMRGDTVFIDKYRQVWRYKEVANIDTIYVSKDKYIRYTVKERLPWYSSVFVAISTMLTLLLLLVLAVAWVMNKRNYFRSRSDGGADKE